MADVRIHAAVPRFPLLVELEPEQRQVLAPKHPDHAAVRRPRPLEMRHADASERCAVSAPSCDINLVFILAKETT